MAWHRRSEKREKIKIQKASAPMPYAIFPKSDTKIVHFYETTKFLLKKMFFFLIYLLFLQHL